MLHVGLANGGGGIRAVGREVGVVLNTLDKPVGRCIHLGFDVVGRREIDFANLPP